MVEVTLGLGGNLGDPVAAFAGALEALDQHPQVTVRARSSVYRTAPWGKTDQPDFSNMAALVETVMPARELLSFCLLIETAAGRRRLQPWGPRTLDIDLLTYGSESISEAGLVLPHPHLLERAFVLVPLAEIVPEMIVAGRSIAAWRDSIPAGDVHLDADGSRRLEALAPTLSRPARAARTRAG